MAVAIMPYSKVVIQVSDTSKAGYKLTAMILEEKWVIILSEKKL